MADGVSSSRWFVLIATKDSFSTPWPIYELLIAQVLQKPVLVVLETDERRGGLTFRAFSDTIPKPWKFLNDHEWIEIKRRGDFWSATVKELYNRLKRRPQKRPKRKNKQVRRVMKREDEKEDLKKKEVRIETRNCQSKDEMVNKDKIEEMDEPESVAEDTNEREDTSESEDGWTTAVFDNGSAWMSVGFAGHDAPQSIFPTIFGRRKDGQNEYVGDEAMSKRWILNIKYPIERGIVTSWDIMEKIWHHAFHHELGILPEETCVLLTEPPMNLKGMREKTSEIMFEKFNTPAMLFQSQTLLSLYAAGRVSGVVVQSGYEVSYIDPIYESVPIPDTAGRLNLAGRDLTDYLATILKENGVWEEADAHPIIRDIKEKLAYCAQDFDSEISAAELSQNVQQYELPDGQVINIKAERIQCPEPLFQPTLIKNEGKGIHQLTLDSIKNCDEDIKIELYSNIVLSGGSTMFRGFDTRLSKEITALAPSAVTVKVIAPVERKYSAWIGGSVLACLNATQEIWITKDEYNEAGPQIVHRKRYISRKVSSSTSQTAE